MFLGQNGVGKSSLLDILGMTREDRHDDIHNKKSSYSRIKASYFMLYHLFDDIYAFEITGNGFLYNMVRIIFGTLLKVAYGKINPKDVLNIILSQNRADAGQTMPPKALYLKSVEY